MPPARIPVGVAALALALAPLARADGPADAFAALAAATDALVAGHRELYTGTRTPEQSLKLPATLWHIGEPTTLGGDLASHFAVARELEYRRDAAKLAALANFADGLRPRAAALREAAQSAAGAARRLAADLAGPPVAAGAVGTPPARDPARAATEPELLLALASSALASGAPAHTAAALEELAGRLGHLADLDRWLELNCRWIRETEEWTRLPGMAPRSLCYDIAARFNEVASLQSRVEDALYPSEAERARWPETIARAAAGAGAARPLADDAVRAQLRDRVAALRAAELALDRRIAPLQHERKFAEVDRLRRGELLPMLIELEYLQRELVLLEGATDGAEPLLSERERRPLSLTARAALDRVAAALDAPARRRFAPVLRDLLDREYLASYADLCLYQAAVLDLAPGLALRIGRWLAIEPKPDPAGLMEILHSTPGAMTTGQRSDNAYQPQLLAWADECRGTDREARFLEALRRANAFYRKTGYNQDQPVSSLRDVLESGLVDCIAGCRIHGAVAAAAGVTGIVPVRYWKDRLGHSLIGLRTGDRVEVYDPLAAGKPRPHPGGFPGVMTVEIGAISFGTYVVDDLEIVSPARRLRRELPYRRPGP